MKRIIPLIAFVALAACDSATGSDRAAREAGSAEARTPTTASFSGGSNHRAAIASVRQRVGGSPALYTARAVVVDGGEVTLEVRSSTGGFSNLTSGTLVGDDVATGEANLDFQVNSGTRYLVIAYPSVNGVVDATHASFIEAVP